MNLTLNLLILSQISREARHSLGLDRVAVVVEVVLVEQVEPDVVLEVVVGVLLPPLRRLNLLRWRDDDVAASDEASFRLPHPLENS